jgi:hypothetical protein
MDATSTAVVAPYVAAGVELVASGMGYSCGEGEGSDKGRLIVVSKGTAISRPPPDQPCDSGIVMKASFTFFMYWVGILSNLVLHSGQQNLTS